MPHKTKKKNTQAGAAKPFNFSLQGQKGALNSALSSLFASSSGPVKTHVKYAPLSSGMTRTVPDQKVINTATSVHNEAEERKDEDGEDDEEQEEDNEELSELSEDFDDEADVPSLDGADDEMKINRQVGSATVSSGVISTNVDKLQDSKKRKRMRDDDNLEGIYLQRLAREEEKEEMLRESERKNKRQKQADQKQSNKIDEDKVNDGQIISNDDTDDVEEFSDVPQHETLAPPKSDTELEKASRTVFLGNVSTTAMTSKSDKKTLLNHLSSFFTSIPAHEPPHKIESIRFRSTAYSTNVPKKAAFAKMELMDTTTKSTNAYVVYSSNKAAREAAQRLNGTIILGRHLRVDEVAHPAKIDNKRCIFVGNLGFVDDESQMKAAAAEMAGKTNSRPSKSRAGDVEEGLWQHFSKAGKIESVRVVRDPKTRVGKGFAYVQFEDQNAVEVALLDNDKRFPPLLPRTLRVVRAKKIIKKNESSSSSNRKNANGDSNTTRPGQSNFGRAKKLLGRAGGANIARDARPPHNHARPGTASNSVEVGTKGGGEKAIKAPETFVFEGHRASNTQGKGALRINKSKGGKKKIGKPRDRSAKRGAAWKSSGGRKGGKGN